MTRVLAAAAALMFVVAVGTVAASADVVSGIVDPYLRIQSALSGDTLEGVAADAGRIATAAGELGPDAAPIKSSAQQLASARDLKAARAAFGTLTDAVLKYAEKTGAGLGDTKLAYCSMEDKHWLQKGEQIANPYYGKKMQRCGEFKTSRK